MTHTHITGFNVFHCNRRPHARVDVYHHGGGGCCGGYSCGSIWGPQNFGAGFGLGMGYGLMNWLGNMFGFGGGMGGFGMGMGMGYGMPGYGMGGYGIGNGWMNGLFGNRTNPYGQGNDDKDQEKLKEFTEELNDIRKMTDKCKRDGALEALKGRLERYQPDSVYGKENDAWKKLIEDTIELLTQEGLDDAAADLKKKQPAGGTGKVDNGGNDGNGGNGGSGALTPAQQAAKAAADIALRGASNLKPDASESDIQDVLDAIDEALNNPDLDPTTKTKLEAERARLQGQLDAMKEEDVEEDLTVGGFTDPQLVVNGLDKITDADYKSKCEQTINGIKIGSKIKLTNTSSSVTQHDINGEVVGINQNSVQVRVDDKTQNGFNLIYDVQIVIGDNQKMKAIVKNVYKHGNNNKKYYLNDNHENLYFEFDGTNFARDGEKLVTSKATAGYTEISTLPQQ